MVLSRDCTAARRPAIKHNNNIVYCRARSPSQGYQWLGAVKGEWGRWIVRFVMVEPRLKVYIPHVISCLRTLTHTQTRMYLHVCAAAEYPVAAGLPEYVTWKTRRVLQTEHKKKTPNTRRNKFNEIIIIIMKKKIQKRPKKCIILYKHYNL